MAFLFSAQRSEAQDLLAIKVSINVQNATIGEILGKIEQQGNFFFAYNPDNINESQTFSIAAQNKKVSDVLKELFPGKSSFRQVENHVIISNEHKSNEKNTFQISGRIADNSDSPLDSVIVYDPENEQLVVSHGDGSFKFDFDAGFEDIGLFVSRPNYNDTVIYVGPGQQQIDLVLFQSRFSPFAMIPKGTAAAEFKIKEKEFERLSLVRKFVPKEAIYASKLNTEKIMPAQLSFLPKAGTNSFVKGLRVNNASFNILAGYSKGLKGAEFGGIANIIQKEARGVQAAGIANIVLGNVTGVQFSGVYTNDFSDVRGFQVSGVHNTLRGDIRGGQIGGVSNIARQGVDGIQLGGIFNLAKGEISGAQISGVLNVARNNIEGAQISGVANISEKTAKGLQIAGIYNKSREIDGWQLSGVANLNGNEDKGIQIAAVANKTKVLHGLQFGIVNIADTISSGFQVGLVNIVKHGTYLLELSYSETFPFVVNFKTGNPKLQSIINLSAGNGMLGTGFGIGRNFEISKKSWASADIVSTSVHDNKMAFMGQKLSTRLALNYKFAKHFSLISGLSGNFFAPSDQWGTSTPGTAYESARIGKAMQNGKNSVWCGWFLGLQISDML